MTRTGLHPDKPIAHGRQCHSKMQSTQILLNTVAEPMAHGHLSPLLCDSVAHEPLWLCVARASHGSAPSVLLIKDQNSDSEYCFYWTWLLLHHPTVKNQELNHPNSEFKICYQAPGTEIQNVFS